MPHLRGSQYYTRQCLLRQTADASTSGCRRRDLLWELGGLVYQEEGLDIEVPVEPMTLPALGRLERLGWEIELLGLTPGDHVVGLYREALRA